MVERFDFLFSLHSFTTPVELLYVHCLFRLVHSCVSGALTFFMLFNAMFHVFSVASVVAAVFTKKDVNIVGHPLSTHLVGNK